MYTLRISFDIGSGATKVCGAIVGVAESTYHFIFEREQPLLIGQAVKNESEDGCTIPKKTVEELRVCISTMCKEVRQALSKHLEANTVKVEGEGIFGIATAIFREAKNGFGVLAGLEKEFGLQVQIISQDLEAELGYKTARAYSSLPSSASIISYDSGGASFQLCTPLDLGFKIFNGSWGSTTSHLALLKLIREGSRSVRETRHVAENEYDPNPVGADNALLFHRYLMQDLENVERHSQKDRDIMCAFIMKGYRVQGIGGPTSAFNMCSKLLQSSSIDRKELFSRTMAEICPLSNSQIRAKGFPQPEVLVAKLILVYSVMTYLDLDHFDFAIAIGNTRAVIQIERFWKFRSRM